MSRFGAYSVRFLLRVGGLTFGGGGRLLLTVGDSATLGGLRVARSSSLDLGFSVGLLLLGVRLRVGGCIDVGPCDVELLVLLQEIECYAKRAQSLWGSPLVGRLSRRLCGVVVFVDESAEDGVAVDGGDFGFAGVRLRPG